MAKLKKAKNFHTFFFVCLVVCSLALAAAFLVKATPARALWSDSGDCSVGGISVMGPDSNGCYAGFPICNAGCPCPDFILSECPGGYTCDASNGCTEDDSCLQYNGLMGIGDASCYGDGTCGGNCNTGTGGGTPPGGGTGSPTCSAGQQVCNGVCTTPACSSDSDCSFYDHCTNAGQCDASCASCAADYSPLGNTCYSGANSCGQTNPGTYQCDGSCNAVTPPDSDCPSGGTSCTPGDSKVCTTDPDSCGFVYQGTQVCRSDGQSWTDCTSYQPSDCNTTTYYSCSSGQCNVDSNCNSSGNGCYTDSTCDNSCGLPPSGPTYYSCFSGSCGVDASCSASGVGCYTDSTCANSCGLPPGGNGSGNLVSCVTNACTGATYAGYYYYPAGNKMVSTYCLPQYDNCKNPTYPTGTIGDVSYWFRVGGKDTSCLNLQSPPAVCPNGSGSFSVSLSASPSSGIAPLPVSLSASVTTPDDTDTLNFSFFWSCSYAGNGGVAGAEAQCGALPVPSAGHCLSNSVGAKCDAMAPGSAPAVGNTYTAGSYHPLVIVEQGSGSPVMGGASVSVSNSSGNGPAPSCTFGASPANVISGVSSTLSWSCLNATSCNLNGSFVSAGSGSLSVKPSVTTVYDLSCSNNSTTTPATKQATVTVTGNPGLIEVNPNSK